MLGLTLGLWPQESPQTGDWFDSHKSLKVVVLQHSSSEPPRRLEPRTYWVRTGLVFGPDYALRDNVAPSLLGGKSSCTNGIRDIQISPGHSSGLELGLAVRLASGPSGAEIGSSTYAPRVRRVTRASNGILLLPAQLSTTSRTASTISRQPRGPIREAETLRKASGSMADVCTTSPCSTA